ncbi:type IV toxin-antitoxin system AbiEi family antitoxin [Allobranchiibius sp. CTAmp26]|uniref:type IV toxin-antitoxin system AbiEi family antitoxin n=1 Tax=Allobranchiibius sp. CTAmp26 TaxID=2815214 RepID=UPI001AA1BECF|nr:hypothetical protein [Allobranchiibius sp. CTAmp26]MBO1756074.1 hypothetical protein [Allobranchiibius sp. CTAmp26]
MTEPSGLAAHRPTAVPAAQLKVLKDQFLDVPPNEAVTWFHLRRDAYIETAVWETLSAEKRLAVRAHVVAAASPGQRVLSHHSAAAIWGIPIVGPWPEKVEVLVPDDTHGVSPGIQRRRTQNMPLGVARGGVTVTSAARTAVDLAKLASLASAVASLDHVLHHKLAGRADLEAEVRAIPKNARGRRRALLAVALARHDAESPAESLSRIRLYEFGMPRPTLQVDFRDAQGFIGRVDMYWPHLDLIGEVDGRLKYGLPPGASSDVAADVLWREKLREDRLRRVADRLTRWTWDDALKREGLRRALKSTGLRPTFDPSWLELLDERWIA